MVYQGSNDLARAVKHPISWKLLGDDSHGGRRKLDRRGTVSIQFYDLLQYAPADSGSRREWLRLDNLAIDLIPGHLAISAPPSVLETLEVLLSARALDSPARLGHMYINGIPVGDYKRSALDSLFGFVGTKRLQGYTTVRDAFTRNGANAISEEAMVSALLKVGMFNDETETTRRERCYQYLGTRIQPLNKLSRRVALAAEIANGKRVIVFDSALNATEIETFETLAADLAKSDGVTFVELVDMRSNRCRYLQRSPSVEHLSIEQLNFPLHNQVAPVNWTVNFHRPRTSPILPTIDGYQVQRPESLGGKLHYQFPRLDGHKYLFFKEDASPTLRHALFDAGLYPVCMERSDSRPGDGSIDISLPLPPIVRSGIPQATRLLTSSDISTRVKQLGRRERAAIRLEALQDALEHPERYFRIPPDILRNDQTVDPTKLRWVVTPRGPGDYSELYYAFTSLDPPPHAREQIARANLESSPSLAA